MQDRNSFTVAGLIAALALIVLGTVGYSAYKAKTPALKHPDADAVIQSAMREVDLSFRVGGTIAEMRFDKNAAVKKGDIIALLDRVPYEQDLAVAKAKLATAQAEAGKARHLSDSSFNSVETARANLDDAQHAYDTAHEEAEKQRGIMTTGPAFSNMLADAVQNESDSLHNLERARRELAQQQDSGIVDRDSASAALQTAQADIAIAETNLANTQLVAPADGVIYARLREAGATVSAGEPVYRFAFYTPDIQ